MDNQMLTRADRCHPLQHRQVELAVGSAVAERVVGTLGERALARDRGDAVCRKDLRAEDGRCHIAHAARRVARQQVTNPHVPGVGLSDVLDVEAKVAPLSRSHRRRARFRDHERRIVGKFHTKVLSNHPFKAEKRATVWCNATAAEINDPIIRVNYCKGNSRGSVMARVRCACAIRVWPKSAKSPSWAVTNTIAVEGKDIECCATELQAGDGSTSVVYDTNHVVVKAIIVRRGSIGVSCCDRPISVERDQHVTTLISPSVLISEIGGTNTQATGITAVDDGAGLRRGKRRLRSHHQNDDAENK